MRPVILVDGTEAILKRYRSHRAADQARRALLGWGPRAVGVRIPRVLAVAPDGPCSLLIERLAGDRADAPGWQADVDVARAMGMALRGLHTVPEDDDDPMPLEAAATRRMQAWLARLRGVPGVPAGLMEAVADRFHPDALRGRRRAPCHRDAEPANLLIWATGGPALVDFEHARMDDPLGDIARTWDGKPLSDSPFTAAVVAAWGSPAPEPALRVHGLLHGVASLVRAHAEGNLYRGARATHLLIQIIHGAGPP